MAHRRGRIQGKLQHTRPSKGAQVHGRYGLLWFNLLHPHDSLYLVKSVPRDFEHRCFRDDLLEPYSAHMRTNQGSLLVRITDFLVSSQSTIGTTFELVPSHHIIMENIKHGRDDERGEQDVEWESYDLKPLSYFYPERDMANGAFGTDEALSKLADKFEDKLGLSLDDAEEFKAQLGKDTALLAKFNAVDYSLFLVRNPTKAAEADQQYRKDSKEDASILPARPLCTPLEPPSWRTGVKSTDGQWLYRAALLDFFWAKHKTTAKMMTGLIKSYNIVDKQGPMSITTNARECRERFLQMCSDMIEVRQGSSF